MIMVTEKGLKKEPLMAEKIDRAVFPGLQGGPHENTIAAMAVALKEAEKESFRQYAYQVVKNARRLVDALQEKGFNLVSGGTDNHLILVDLRNKNIDGKKAAVILEKAGIIVNANSIPHDPRPPFRPSGIRLGTPALTSRGMKEEEMEKIAELIEKVISSPQEVGQVKKEVKKLTLRFPIYSREVL